MRHCTRGTRSSDAALIRGVMPPGWQVNAWTCDDPVRMRELIGWGIDGICTNVPDVAVASFAPAPALQAADAGNTNRTALGTKSNSSRSTSPR